MIVYDLRCGDGHVFEAWFGTGSDYDDQQARGLLKCPICGDRGIGKAAMAPAVPAKTNRGEVSASAVKALMGKVAAAQRKALQGADYVGDRFASEARAMHHGEAEARGIYGQATLGDARALADEGVPVAPLLLPVVPPEQQN